MFDVLHHLHFLWFSLQVEQQEQRLAQRREEHQTAVSRVEEVREEEQRLHNRVKVTREEERRR